MSVVRRHWSLVLGLLGLLILHAPGWWGGEVFAMEDVLAQFFTLKARMYALAWGLEEWSWWDPLWQLGTPRLANVQAGWLCPFSLWFVALPAPLAWRFYALFIDATLLLCAYAALREMGASRVAGGWGAAVWVCCGSILILSQDPCYKEALVASCLFVFFSLRWWRDRRRRWLLGLASCGALHLVAGSPSALFFDHAGLAPVLLVLAWSMRPRLAVLLCGCAAYGAGLLLASPTWLAFQDYFAHSHRSLGQVATVKFAETYRLTAAESLYRLCAESYIDQPVFSALRPGYPLPLDFSLATTLLFASALAVPRLRLLAVAAALLTLQAMGERGGLVWILHQVIPSTLQVRGPLRFTYLGAFAMAAVAALAWDHWRGSGRRTRILSGCLAAWGALFAVGAHIVEFQRHYLPAEVLSSPVYPPGVAGRLAAFAGSKTRAPLPWQSIGVVHGHATLVLPEALFERGYLLGMAYSQWGERGAERLGPMVGNAGVPLVRPDVPLLRAWGLTWLLEAQQGGFQWRRVQPDPPRHWLAAPTRMSEAAWAARPEGDAFGEAYVEDVRTDVSTTGTVSAEVQQADYQRLAVAGSGLLVSQDQWDPGWQCFHDGVAAPVLRVNLAQKGCWVLPGTKVVEWRYSLPWLQKFWLCHACGWILLLAALVAAPRVAGPPGAQA
jgi:hypothetical protein